MYFIYLHVGILLGRVVDVGKFEALQKQKKVSHFVHHHNRVLEALGAPALPHDFYKIGSIFIYLFVV